MDRFVSSVKNKYQSRRTYREDCWPPCSSNELIRLELIENKEKVDHDHEHHLFGEKNSQDKDTSKYIPLAYGDLFKVESGKRPVRKVLVEGGAGIGKTTLCIAVSEDWANGKLFQQFELLLLLPLRHPKVSSARSLSELLKLLHLSKNVCESVVSYLEESEGENVLIIADGWDELDKSQQKEGSFLYDLLLMELQFASVLVTSRPSVSGPLHKYMDRFIDILGFDQENIEEFIQAEFANDHQTAIGLSKQLESNPLVESVCSVPLNCAIVCHLWRTLGEALPTTMTELYRKIILNFILRNIRKADIYNDIKILIDFDSLPNDLQQSWWRLCEFAFQALIRNQIMFSQESPIDEELLFFGLLQPAETILETGCEISYHFLHLTFQEYLAALHMVKHPLDQHPTLSQSLDSDIAIFYAISDNFTMVWRFYFGIYFHESKKGREKPDIQQIRQHISGIKTFIDDGLLLWHCAFEADSKDVVDEILMTNLNNKIDNEPEMNVSLMDYINFGEPSNAHDCAAVLYAISNIQEYNNMVISFHNCGVRDNQIQTLGKILAEKGGKIQVQILCLSGNKLTDVSICSLFQRASNAFQSLKILDLSNNKLGAGSIKSITTALKQLPSHILSYLNLSKNPLMGVPGIKALEDAIRCDTLVKLTELNLAGFLTYVSSEVMANFIEAISFHCPNLHTLRMCRESTPATLHSLTEKHSGMFQADMLDLDGNGLNDKYVCELILRASVAFQSLKVINLSNNGVGVETIKAISLMLQRAPSNGLETLDLSTNPLGVSGIQALEDAVCDGSLRNLHKLSLKKCLTNDSDINGALLTTLVEGLSIHCPCFASLDLSQNNLCTPGALAIWSPKQLAYLNFSETMLGDNGLTNLLLEIPCFDTPVSLILQDNNIHGSNVSCLLASIEQWREVNLNNNPLGVEGVIPIGRLITSSKCHLKTLELSQCQLTLSGGNLVSYGYIEVVKDVGQQLYQMSPNNTITKLNLSHSNFSEECIHILAGFMYLCLSLKYLYSSHCQINSYDLKELLDRLSEFQASSPDVCSKLVFWDLNSNKIDDNGISLLIDHHLTSLLPLLGCQHGVHAIQVNDNPISSEILKRLRKELNRRRYGEARKNDWQTNPYLSSTKEDLQPQWEFIVSLLYETMVRDILPSCSSIHLMVVGEEETMIKPSTQENHDGPIPTLSMSIPHSMHLPADDSETIAESQGTHSDSDNIIIVTSQSDELVSTFHSNDNEEVKETDVNQPLVETDEESNAVKQAMAAVPFLTVDDLASVQRAVWEGRAKWYNIGLELGLTAGTLDAIQLDHPHNTEHCFRATLKEWLSRADLYPSWSGLARCLKAPPVGLGHLEEYLMADLDANKSYND